jgi:cell division protein FtsB
MPSTRGTPARGSSRSATPGPGRGRSGRAADRRAPSTRRTSRAAGATTKDGPAGRKPRLTGRAAILALVVAVLIVSYASSLRVWLEQRRNIAELEQQITASQTAVASLRQQKLRWHDPAYVEIQAKQRLQWVLPGEIGYRIVGADAKSTVRDPLAGPGDTVTGSAPQWWEGVWGSVEHAGLRQKPGRSAPDRRPVRQIGPQHDLGHGPGSGPGSRPGRSGQGPDR